MWIIFEFPHLSYFSIWAWIRWIWLLVIRLLLILYFNQLIILLLLFHFVHLVETKHVWVAIEIFIFLAPWRIWWRVNRRYLLMIYYLLASCLCLIPQVPIGLGRISIRCVIWTIIIGLLYNRVRFWHFRKIYLLVYLILRLTHWLLTDIVITIILILVMLVLLINKALCLRKYIANSMICGHIKRSRRSC